jgi:hypothetical protein
MATTPAFSSTPRVGSAQVSAANTNRDGTGTVVDVLTGVAAGTKVFEVVVQATGTTTAGMVRLYYYDGTNTRLWDEILVSAITPGASTQAFRYSKTYSNLLLAGSTHKLQASTHNAETFNVIASGGDLT